MSGRPLLRTLRSIGAAMRETPLVRLEHGRVDLHAKLEYTNPTGSSKDRAAYWMLKRAVERGDVLEATTVVESSSGNLAIALATMCRALGLAFIPVIDPNCNASTEAFLRRVCERVEKVTERDPTGGYLATRLARVARLVEDVDEAYWPNQYGNIDAVLGHYRLTGGELVRSFEQLDYVFIGVSTGGTIGGLSLRLKESFPGICVIAVDVEGSVIFGGPPRTRLIPGLGSSFTPPLFEHALIDDLVVVSERDTVSGCHELLARHGLYTGGSSGTVYTAVDRYFAGHTGRRPTVAFVCPDRGTAYADTIYDPAWVAQLSGEATLPPPRPARELDVVSA